MHSSSFIYYCNYEIVKENNNSLIPVHLELEI